MALNKVKTKFKGRVKPNVPVEIDWSNQLSRGLIAFVIFNGHGKDVVNLVNNRPFAGVTDNILNRSATTRGFDQYGSKLISSVGPNRIKLIPDSDIKSDTDYCFLGGVKYDNTTQDHTHVFIGDAGPGSTNTILMWADTTGGNLRTAFNSGGTVVGSSGSLVANKYTIWGANFTTGSSTTSETFVDGVSEASGSTGSTSSMSNKPFYILEDVNQVRSLTGDVYFFALWERNLTDAEHKAFSNDPYSLLKPSLPQYYFTTAAAPPSTTVPVFIKHFRNQGFM